MQLDLLKCQFGLLKCAFGKHILIIGLLKCAFGKHILIIQIDILINPSAHFNDQKFIVDQNYLSIWTI